MHEFFFPKKTLFARRRKKRYSKGTPKMWESEEEQVRMRVAHHGAMHTPLRLRTTWRFSPGAGMGRMVAVSVTPRGTGTAGLLLIDAGPPPLPAAESGAGAGAPGWPGAGARAGPGPADGAGASWEWEEAGGRAALRLASPPLPRRQRSVGSLGRVSSPPPPSTGGGAASGAGEKPDSCGEGSGTMTARGTFSST